MASRIVSLYPSYMYGQTVRLAEGEQGSFAPVIWYDRTGYDFIDNTPFWWGGDGVNNPRWAQPNETDCDPYIHGWLQLQTPTGGILIPTETYSLSPALMVAHPVSQGGVRPEPPEGLNWWEDPADYSCDTDEWRTAYVPVTLPIPEGQTWFLPQGSSFHWHGAVTGEYNSDFNPDGEYENLFHSGKNMTWVVENDCYVAGHTFYLAWRYNIIEYRVSHASRDMSKTYSSVVVGEEPALEPYPDGVTSATRVLGDYNRFDLSAKFTEDPADTSHWFGLALGSTPSEAIAAANAASVMLPPPSLYFADTQFYSLVAMILTNPLAGTGSIEISAQDAIIRTVINLGGSGAVSIASSGAVKSANRLSGSAAVLLESAMSATTMNKMSGFGGIAIRSDGAISYNGESFYDLEFFMFSAEQELAGSGSIIISSLGSMKVYDRSWFTIASEHTAWSVAAPSSSGWTKEDNKSDWRVEG